MKRTKDFFDLAIPWFWGMCWVVIITAGSLGLGIVAVKWLLKVLGVL